MYFSRVVIQISIMLSEVVCGYGTFSVLKCLDFDISGARLYESNGIKEADNSLLFTTRGPLFHRQTMF